MRTLALILVLFSPCAQAQLATLCQQVTGGAAAWTPASPTTGGFSPVGWWKADSGAYVDAGSTLATDGQTVNQWNDASGAGPNLIQGDSTARPTWIASSQGGKPTLKFTQVGTDRHLTNVWASAMNSSNTVFIVCYVTNTATYRRVIDGRTDNKMSVIYWAADELYCQGSSTSIIHPPGPQDVFTYITVAITNSSTTPARTNGVAMSVTSGDAGTVTSDGVTAGARYGGTQGLDGCISEIVWYHRLLDSTDIAQVEAYLADKYGL